jgi:FixJ family two-component response regulator/tRNA A-37 threonylcarbamoyl transferase component Bud32
MSIHNQEIDYPASPVPRILVVDDEPFIRTTLREIFQDEGYFVREASCAESCLEILASDRMDVVLLDIKMPGMDGMEAFKVICKERYKCDVIMISGHGTIETAVEAIKYGAVDFLEKPFSLAKITGVVKSVLSRRRDGQRLDDEKEKDRIVGRKYRIVGKIASGGSATVYRAVQTDLERTVALKVLHSYLTGTESFHERFLREARITASLSHPGIVQLYDYGREGNSHYLAMEFVDGPSLEFFLNAKKKPTLSAGMLVMRDVCRALEHAHGHNIIHRDLKPQNILIARGGAVKLVDFGLARLLDSSLQKLTAQGHIAGTPQFISPEQVSGREPGTASDIFSMGTLLYLLATSRLPFVGANIAEIVHRVSIGKYEDPRTLNPAISERLKTVIATCLQHEPADRYASAGELRKNLEACIDDKKVAGRNFTR